MTWGGEADELSEARKRDEANIRWLLAAVLHHQSEEIAADEEE